MPAQRTDREPVVLVDGVTPETVIDAILDAIDVAYRDERKFRRETGVTRTARVSLPAHFVDWLYQQVDAAAITHAREAGAEAMRERAADIAMATLPRSTWKYPGHGDIATAILALPLTEVIPDGK